MKFKIYNNCTSDNILSKLFEQKFQIKLYIQNMSGNFYEFCIRKTSENVHVLEYFSGISDKIVRTYKMVSDRPNEDKIVHIYKVSSHPSYENKCLFNCLEIII